jgi:hypothetical protein
MNEKILQFEPMKEVLAKSNVQKMHIAWGRQSNYRGNLGSSTKGASSNCCTFCNR